METIRRRPWNVQSAAQRVSSASNVGRTPRASRRRSAASCNRSRAQAHRRHMRLRSHQRRKAQSHRVLRVRVVRSHWDCARVLSRWLITRTPTIGGCTGSTLVPDRERIDRFAAAAALGTQAYRLRVSKTEADSSADRRRCCQSCSSDNSRYRGKRCNTVTFSGLARCKKNRTVSGGMSRACGIELKLHNF